MFLGGTREENWTRKARNKDVQEVPALKPKMVIRALKRKGFVVDHTTGSHYILMREKRRVVVPYHNRDLKPGTLASIIAQAGLTVETFLDLL